MKPGKSFTREEVLFVIAVLTGSVSGLVAGRLLVHWVARATHARLVHRRAIGSLLRSVAVGAPLAYVIMRLLHALLES